MLGTRKIWIIAGSAAIFIAAAALFMIVPSIAFRVLPAPVQRTYLRLYYALNSSNLRADSEFMKREHQATHLRPVDDVRPYNFQYSAGDIGVITGDSLRCQACHGSMLQYEGGRRKYPLHAKMLKVSLVKFHCVDCHKKVDLGRRNPARATIRIDRTQCIKCHESDVGYPETIGGSRRLSDSNVPEVYLISNHGVDKRSGKAWPAGRHAKVAASVGVKKCRRCHQPAGELDFCDDCHGRSGLKALIQ